MSFELNNLESKVKSTMKLVWLSQFIKYALSITIVVAYFNNYPWLTEILAVSVVVVLVIPLGFYGSYIQTLLEYQNQMVRDSQDKRTDIIEGYIKGVNHKIEELENDVQKLKDSQ